MVMNLHQYRFKNALTSRRKWQNKILCLGLVYWGDKNQCYRLYQIGYNINLLDLVKLLIHLIE